MPTIIISFGFRHGRPDAEANALVLDVRTHFTRNPFHNKSLRKLRGTDEAVQKDIQRTPNFEASFAKLRAVVAAHQGPVYLGCTGGHHRSVYLAELFGKAFNVPVLHLNIKDK